nr:MAG TPA: hypothetical protein [Caudoviricetes sp.]
MLYEIICIRTYYYVNNLNKYLKREVQAIMNNKDKELDKLFKKLKKKTTIKIKK